MEAANADGDAEDAALLEVLQDQGPRLDESQSPTAGRRFTRA